MELSWYGLSCFRITEKGNASVVTDPFDSAVGITLPDTKAEIVTISHDASGHNYADAVSETRQIFTGPGEYELGNVFITGIASFNDDGERNVHYVYRFNHITIAHLGDLSTVPTKAQLESLGNVNVLLLPVGGGKSLTASQAAEVVSILAPSYVIPMHYKTDGVKLDLEPIDRFMKEFGVADDLEKVDSFKLTSSTMPETTQIVLLNQKTA